MADLSKGDPALSEKFQDIQHRMIKWQGSVSPALQIAAGQALLPTKGGLKRSRAGTHALFVEVKDASRQFDVVSGKVVPMAFVDKFHPRSPLLEEVADEERRPKLSEKTGTVVVDAVITCIVCWVGPRGLCVSDLLSSVITLDHLTQFANAKFDPDWEKTLKGSNDFKWLVGPSGKGTYAVRRDGREEDDMPHPYY